MLGGNARSAADVVSLAERLRHMQLLRLALVVAASSFSLLAPELIGGRGFGDLLAGTGLYLLLSLVSEGIWRLSRRRGLTLFGGMLILDGVYLAWLSYMTGGSGSPLRYLIVLHLVAVALLASYRTGLKLALWHSLLLILVFHAQEAKILEPTKAAIALPGTEFQRLVAFVAVFWLVALATATFSAVNERELRRRRYDVEELAALATELEQTRGSLAVGDVLLDRVADVFGFRRAALFSVRRGDRALLAARGCERAVGVQPRAGEASVLRRAVNTRETQLPSDLDPRDDAWLLRLMPGAANLVVVPLSAEATTIAVLVAEHGERRTGRIERRIVSMVERFCAHAALALRNAWLLEQLQSMAATDGLTMIANRRTFELTLEQEVSRARRTGDELSIVMLDIDHFKQLNDTHGHQAGDDVLRGVAALLKKHCRDFDTAARYGGEEFAVLLPGSSAPDALRIAERLRGVIAGAETVAPVTASLGTATFTVDAIDEASLVRAADEALYESKRAGRNRVTAAARRGRIVGLPDPEAATF